MLRIRGSYLRFADAKTQTGMGGMDCQCRMRKWFFTKSARAAGGGLEKSGFFFLIVQVGQH